MSHASEDAVTAGRVVVLLERLGLRGWNSARDIPEGADHAAVVPVAVRESQALVLLLSAHALASPWVRREVEAAISSGVPIYPLALPGFPEPETMPEHWRFRLSGSQIRVDGNAEALASTIAEELLGPLSSQVPANGESAGGGVDAPRTEVHPVRVAGATPGGFVGSARRVLLDEIEAAWHQVVVQRSSRVFVLLAETGFGKTRIVQELYRRIAAVQPLPPFWPADLVERSTHGQRALRESRKRVSPPEFQATEGAAAAFIWLGHVVDEGHGGRVDVGLHHVGQEISRALSMAAAAQPDGPAASMISRTLDGTLTPGTDTRIALAELLRRGEPGESGAVPPGSVEAFWQAIRGLWSRSADSVPAVLVIEDGHFAGQETVSALEALATSDGMPFLVIVCAQESQLGGEGPAESGAGFRRPLGRLVDQKLPSLSVRHLTRLGDDDVRALFIEAIPDLDSQVASEALRKVDGNPYHAHTLLVEMVRAAEQQRLDLEWIQRRPGSFEDELRLQWRLLPVDVRRLLSAIAVLGTQVPERIGVHAIRSVYEEDPSADVAASVGTGWLRRLASDEVLRFLERPRWLIANAESFEEWVPLQRRRIIAEALSTLESMASEAGGLNDPLLQEVHIGLALAADRESIPFDRVVAVRSGLVASLRLRLANDDAGCLAAAQETESLVVGHEREPGMAILAVESALALKVGLVNGLAVTGTHARTVEMAELAVRRAQVVAERRGDLAARAYAALARANRVRFDAERLAMAAEALAQAEHWLGTAVAPDVQTRAEVLHARAMMAKARGDNQSGAELAERRLALLEGAYGALDRRVVVALLNCAYYWNRIDVERALSLKEELLSRRMRIWGDSAHPAVAIAEKELAFTLVRLPRQDRLVDAFELSEKALSTLVRARGAYHAHALLARGVVCFAACRLSDELETADAEGQARDLREAALTRALDNVAHTPSATRLATLNARRRRVAELQIRLDDPSGIATLEDILGTQIGTGEAGDSEAAEDLEVLWTVAEIVAGLWRLGRVDESVAMAARFPVERDDRWPAYQPRGWRSTRPQDVRAGVL